MLILRRRQAELAHGEDILRLLGKTPHMEILKLACIQCYMSTAQLMSIAQTCPRLSTLDVSAKTDITNARQLPTPPTCGRLQELTIQSLMIKNYPIDAKTRDAMAFRLAHNLHDVCHGLTT